MNEADRIDKYNDMKALLLLLESGDSEDVKSFLQKEKDRLFLSEIL